MSRFPRAASIAALAIAAVAGAAGPDPGISVELNRLRPVSDGCDALLVLHNRMSTALETFNLDLVMFDAEGIVAKRLAVDGAPLAAGKTVVRQFVIRDVECANLSRVLLNDVPQCRLAGSERRDCATLVTTTSRSKVAFFK